jgi:hypothetical protein
MKKCRLLSNRNEASWAELSEYQDAKAEYIQNKRLAHIFGEINADLN